MKRTVGIMFLIDEVAACAVVGPMPVRANLSFQYDFTVPLLGPQADVAIGSDRDFRMMVHGPITLRTAHNNIIAHSVSSNHFEDSHRDQVASLSQLLFRPGDCLIPLVIVFAL